LSPPFGNQSKLLIPNSVAQVSQISFCSKYKSYARCDILHARIRIFVGGACRFHQIPGFFSTHNIEHGNRRFNSFGSSNVALSDCDTCFARDSRLQASGTGGLWLLADTAKTVSRKTQANPIAGTPLILKDCALNFINCQAFICPILLKSRRSPFLPNDSDLERSRRTAMYILPCPRPQ
jgi:hypothetical protein